jgi:hypothetical protein
VQGQSLNQLFIPRGVNQTADIYTGQMNMVGVNLARLDNLLGLRQTNLGRHGTVGI